jgi:hypothetical protein
LVYAYQVEQLTNDIKKELPKRIRRNKLIDWMIDKQRSDKFYCNQATIQEIVSIARGTGIKVLS